MESKDMEKEEVAKTNSNKLGVTTAIISLAMLIASISMFFLMIVENKMRMVFIFGNHHDEIGNYFALVAIIFSIISFISFWGKEGKIRYKIIDLVSFIMGILMIMILALSFNVEQARRNSCASNLKQIWLAICMYSQENKGQFPDKDGARGLEMLRSGEYLVNEIMYKCYSNCSKDTELKFGETLVERKVDYVYVGGYNENTSPTTVIAYDKPNNHYKFRNVLFADGHVSGYSDGSWMSSRNNEILSKPAPDDKAK